MAKGHPDNTRAGLSSTIEPRERVESSVTEVPSSCTLSGFTAQSGVHDGVDVQSLAPLSRLRVRTQNSTYEMWVIDPQQWTVFIRGGSFFPTLTPAILCGSGYGGSLLKVAWVGVGMSCELTHSQGRIVTSLIKDVEILDDAGIPGPF